MSPDLGSLVVRAVLVDPFVSIKELGVPTLGGSIGLYLLEIESIYFWWGADDPGGGDVRNKMPGWLLAL